MSELFASIKAIIEKGNIIIFLLSLALSIFSYKVILKDWLWAIFVFCIGYVVIYWINSLLDKYNESIKRKNEDKEKQEFYRNRKQNENAQAKQQQEQTEAQLRMLYDSFPADVKEGLIGLYKLPQTEGGYLNSRILYDADFVKYQSILNACQQIRYTIGIGREDLIDIHPSINSQIITIAPDFYRIIEEKGNEVIL
jgi:hypothetical protein